MSKLLLDAGSGGKASQRLINEIFLSHFNNEILARMDDAALLPPLPGKIAISTDSYTVSPLFFPGGSIGSLAINGTVNDVAMLGAKPLYLSCAFILEEGLSLNILEEVVKDMAKACNDADIKIVTGDTKVVPSGVCDKIFINTTGIGEVLVNHSPSGHNAKAGDVVLINGDIGDHGLAVMAARNDISFISDVRSDCAPLASMIKSMLESGACHVLRDPTRGGLATTLNEIAEQSGVGIEIDEDRIPIQEAVKDGCSFLGFDPLYLANEGKCICIAPEKDAQKIIQAMSSSPYGKDSAIIGRVTKEHSGKVILNTKIGGKRFLGMLEGAQLPRIC